MGITEIALRHRLRPGGPWQEILPRTYLTVTGEPTREQREIAALLYAGPGSVITGPAALRRHWIRCSERSSVDVLVAAECLRRSVSFAVLQRTRRMPEVAVDSVEFHFSLADWRHTVSRHRRMTAAGLLVLHVTPQQLGEDPAQIAADIAAALARGQAPPGITARTVAA